MYIVSIEVLFMASLRRTRADGYKYVNKENLCLLLAIKNLTSRICEMNGA